MSDVTTETKKDRRIQRTEKALRNALAELLLEKDLRSITVRELAERADIHRGTFYAHYQDLYELFEQIENEVFKELASILVFNPGHDYTQIFTVLFDYAEENADSFRILYSNSTVNYFPLRLSDFITERAIAITLADENMTSDEMPGRWKLLLRYSVAGLLSIFESWIQSDFTEDKGELVRFSIEVDNHMDKLF